MKKLIFILFVWCLPVVVIGQQSIKGTILDSTNHAPIEFVNIGIVGKGVGTVTDDKGEFSLLIPDSLLNETVRVSILGYKTKTFKGINFKQGIIIYLASDVTVLNEVIVQVKKTKIKMLGNDTRTRHVSAGFKKNNLGAEIAIKLNIKQPQTQLRKFYINITANSLAAPIFRFNVYRVDKNGMPGENILTQNVLIEPKTKTGLVELDLMPYHVYVDEDVFIAIEWIKDLGDVTGLSFSTKLVGSATYYRVASQDQWHKIPSLGIGLHAEVGY